MLCPCTTCISCHLHHSHSPTCQILQLYSRKFHIGRCVLSFLLCIHLAPHQDDKPVLLLHLMVAPPNTIFCNIQCTLPQHVNLKGATKISSLQTWTLGMFWLIYTGSEKIQVILDWPPSKLPMHSSSLLRSHIEDVHLPIEAAVSTNLSLVKNRSISKCHNRPFLLACGDYCLYEWRLIVIIWSKQLINFMGDLRQLQLAH